MSIKLGLHERIQHSCRNNSYSWTLRRPTSWKLQRNLKQHESAFGRRLRPARTMTHFTKHAIHGCPDLMRYSCQKVALCFICQLSFGFQSRHPQAVLLHFCHLLASSSQNVANQQHNDRKQQAPRQRVPAPTRKVVPEPASMSLANVGVLRQNTRGNCGSHLVWTTPKKS